MFLVDRLAVPELWPHDGVCLLGWDLEIAMSDFHRESHLRHMGWSSVAHAGSSHRTSAESALVERVFRDIRDGCARLSLVFEYLRRRHSADGRKLARRDARQPERGYSFGLVVDSSSPCRFSPSSQPVRSTYTRAAYAFMVMQKYGIQPCCENHVKPCVTDITVQMIMSLGWLGRPCCNAGKSRSKRTPAAQSVS